MGGLGRGMRPTLKLITNKPDVHRVLVEFLNQMQEQMELLVQDVTRGQTTEANAALLDVYASVQNKLGAMRAAAIDHAYVANKLDWVQKT